MINSQIITIRFIDVDFKSFLLCSFIEKIWATFAIWPLCWLSGIIVWTELNLLYIRKLNMLSHLHVWLWHKYHLFNLLRILFRPKISSFLKIANGYSFFILLSKELRQKGQRENLHKVNKVEPLLLSVVILSAHLHVWSEI